MKKFIIVANDLKEQTKECVALMERYIKKYQGECVTVWIRSNTDLEQEITTVSIHEAEAVIVVGGDGTMIRASRVLKKLKIPFVGVNVGTIGFLCEIDKEHIEDSIQKLIANDFEIESRMLLYGSTKSQGEGNALNEIAIYRGGQLCVISLKLYVDGQYLTTYRGDGVVVSTPTGSTGYSMSCGGPIINPTSKMIVVTPIAPHSISSSRSIVLEDTVEIEIQPEFRNRGEEEVLVSFDGATTYPLVDGIRIKKSKEIIQLIRLNKTGFLEVLKQKL